MAIVSEELLNKTLNSKIIYTRITIMTFNFVTTDEITGVVIGNPSFTNDATSDIRRTMSIELYPTDATYDITRGGKIWMDKYVKVELGFKQFQTDEHIDYFNMGIYVIDNPTKTYSPTENKLTLNCLDIMSRLTGIRGGVIEGMNHVIPAGSNVRSAIIAVLKEGNISKYVVEECTIDVPNDITVDGGSSLYDILTELVQLLPNYQIYFDVDGVFHYELIPNGVNEPVMIDDSVWKNALINYDVAYDFESVKNNIEVLGQAHDNPHWVTTVDYSKDSNWNGGAQSQYVTIETIKLYYDTTEYPTVADFYTLLNGEYESGKAWYDYECGYICVELPKITNGFSGYINVSKFEIYGVNNTKIGEIQMNKSFESDLPLDDSIYFYVKLQLSNATISNNSFSYCTYTADYIGGYQPYASIHETNPNSPFYGDIDHYVDAEYRSTWYSYWAGYEDVHVDYLKILVDAPFDGFLFSTRTFQYTIHGDAKTSVSDLRVTDDTLPFGAGYCAFELYYKKDGKYVHWGKMPAEPELLLAGTHIVKCCNFMNGKPANFGRFIFKPYQPVSLGTLRIVLSGDEYDNIWSDDLAMQRAKFELYQRCRLLDTVTLTILPIYWLDVNWLVELTLPNETGTEETNQYLIKSISTDGGVSGIQTVTLMRYYPYYPSIN